MSIKGFSINGEVQRYDYNALDNLPPQASGLSDEAKQALLACFENVAWINADGQTYYDALEAALYPGAVYSITNVLTGCTSTNTATAIMEGDTYAATIIPSSGYTLDGATVTITMGGATVTGHYNNGAISIPNVTGNLVITVVATSAVASITAVFTQGQNVIYTHDSLDKLRQYLVVTATYADSSTVIVSDYSLIGTLTAGTSTITVSYGGQSDTISVTVTAGVPSDYQVVEYLTAAQTNSETGAYINTGVHFTSPTLATYKAGFMQVTNNSLTEGQHVIATRQTSTGTTNNIGYALYVNAGHVRLVSWSGSPGAALDISDSYIYYDLIATRNSSTYTMAIQKGDETPVSYTYADTSVMRGCSGNDIGIFGNPSLASDKPGATYLFNGRIYYAQAYQDGTKLFDLVPCVRKSDNKPGMYDLVRNVFLTASKAGTNGNANQITAGPAL